MCSEVLRGSFARSSIQPIPLPGHPQTPAFCATLPCADPSLPALRTTGRERTPARSKVSQRRRTTRNRPPDAPAGRRHPHPSSSTGGMALSCRRSTSPRSTVLSVQEVRYAGILGARRARCYPHNLSCERCPGSCADRRSHDRTFEEPRPVTRRASRHTRASRLRGGCRDR